MEDRYHTETAKMDRVLKETLEERIRFNILKYQPIRARDSRHVIPVFSALPYRYRADRDPW